MGASEELFLELSNTIKTERGRESFRHVKEACDTLARSGAHITPASVGRECLARWGWPRTASIRNSGNVLMRYINLRRDEQNLRSKKLDTEELPITDPTALALIRVYRAEADSWKRRFYILKRLMSQVSPVDVDKIESELVKNGVISSTLKPTDLQPACDHGEHLKQLAKQLLDEAHLAEFGLEHYRDNICLKVLHRVFLSSELVSFLRTIAGPSYPLTNKQQE